MLFVGPTATYSSSFGQGSGPIQLNSVACIGSESRLYDCPSGRDTLLCHKYCAQCTHAYDAGVRCSVQTGNVYLERDPHITLKSHICSEQVKLLVSILGGVI